MRISDFSILNPVKVTVGVILIWIFGLLALFQIPVQLTPEVTKPIIAVQTRWVGKSPEEIEKEIVSKQEEQLQTVQGMVDFRSTCSNGWGEIEMEFAVGTDIDSARLAVANKLDQIEEYPEDADEPTIESVTSESSSIAYFSLMALPPTREQLEAFHASHPQLSDVIGKLLARPEIDVTEVYALSSRYPELKELTKNDPDPTNLRRFAEDVLAARFERVEGVADAEVYGGSQEELRVIVDPSRLAAHRISIPELRAALAVENRDVSAGDVWDGKRRYVIRTLGRFTSPADIEDVIVTRRDGAPVYVRDIAQVRLENSKTLGIGRQRGVNMLTIAIKREQGANVLKVMDGVMRTTKELNEGMLKSRGLQLFQVYDETVYIESATTLVRNNIFIGGFLAIAVLLIFLRSGRSTLVIALAIPISIIGTFLIIRLLGRSINVISLAGMAFSVGMVVDAAIVVLENIYSHYQRGERPREAASRGTSEVWGAILASTLTTLAVFLPVIFIQEQAGQLFRDIAIAICAGVSLSLLVSLTVIPAAASRLLRERDAQPVDEKPPQARGIAAWGAAANEALVRMTERLQQGQIGPLMVSFIIVLFVAGALGMVPVEYRIRDAWPYYWPVFPALGLAVAATAVLLFLPLAMLARRAALTTAMIVFALGASYKLMLPAEYLPEGNKNQVRASLQPPPGYNIDQCVKLGETVEERLRPYWEAEPGSPEAEALDGPVIANFFLVARGGTVFMGARSVDPDRAKEMIPVLRKATSNLPGVNSFVNQTSLFERSRSGGRTIDIEITGPELDKLIELGQHIMDEVLAMYPPDRTETSVRPMPSLDLGSPEVHVVPNREKAKERGISTEDLGYTINALVDGAYAGTYWHQGKEIDLVIYGADEFASRMQDVAYLPIMVPTGELVTIADVADVTYSAGPEMISRIDRERAITIQVRPGPDIPLETAIARIDNEVLSPLRQRGDLIGIYHFHMAGTADDLKQMRGQLSYSMFLALVITFLLIAALYESFLYPLVIMVSVPMAAVGGFAGLRLLNLFTVQQMDTLTMLGFIILVGTVVNNAILIVNQALVLIREEGFDHREAVTESVRGRIRPIFMSTLTTCLGMLPLVLFPGAGSELYRGLGSVVLGGLLVSTVVTIFLVPMLFSLTFELKSTMVGWRDAIRRKAVPAPAVATDG